MIGFARTIEAFMKITSALFAFVAGLTSLFGVGICAATDAGKDQTSIRPFTVPTVPQSALDDLRHRVAAMRWPVASPPGCWTMMG